MPPKVMVAFPDEEGPTRGPDLSFLLRPHKDFWADATGPSPARPAVNQHSRSTSNMNNPEVNIDQVRLTRTPPMHQPLILWENASSPSPPRSLFSQGLRSASTIDSPKTNVDQVRSAPSSRKRTPLETSTPTSPRERAVSPDISSTFIRDDTSAMNNPKTNVDEVEPASSSRKKHPRSYHQASNPDLNPSINESDLENKNLDTLNYSELRKMCNDPTSKVHYGCDALYTATMRAKFKGKELDELHVIDRNKIPKKYHEILNQVIDEKTLVMFDEI